MIKKVVAQFDKKIVAWRKKSTNDSKKESISANPEEEPIAEDSKKTLSLRTLKRILLNEKHKEDLITVNPKDSPINEEPQEIQNPQWLLRRKKTLFGFLGMVYEREGDGDKVSNENLGLRGPSFHATSHLKIETKPFFS